MVCVILDYLNIATLRSRDLVHQSLVVLSFWCDDYIIHACMHAVSLLLEGQICLFTCTFWDCVRSADVGRLSALHTNTQHIKLSQRQGFSRQNNSSRSRSEMALSRKTPPRKTLRKILKAHSNKTLCRNVETFVYLDYILFIRQLLAASTARAKAAGEKRVAAKHLRMMTTKSLRMFKG